MQNQQSKEGLKRIIGSWALCLNLVNIIIGAGIFVLPALVAEGLGNAAVYAYLVCGVLITLVMLCFAEAGSQISDSGGAYAYIERSFGAYFGFVTSLLFMVAVISANAAVANAIADILGSMTPLFRKPPVRILFFFLLFGGLALVNTRGVKQGIGLVKWVTILKLSPLILILLIGPWFMDWDQLQIASNPSFSKVGEVSLILFFAFQGAESGLAVSGEVKDPGKTVPKAIIMAISIVLGVYILLQLVAQGILGDALALNTENPLAEVASEIAGPVGFTVITIGAAVSMFGNIGGSVLSLPRVLFGAAKDKVVPIKALARVHPKFATPYVSIILYAGLAFILASVGGFKQLAILASASILLIYLGVALSVIQLRRTRKERSFSLPGGIGIPVLASLAIIWFLSHMSKKEFQSIGAFIVGVSLLYLFIHFKRIFKKS